MRHDLFAGGAIREQMFPMLHCENWFSLLDDVGFMMKDVEDEHVEVENGQQGEVELQPDVHCAQH